MKSKGSITQLLRDKRPGYILGEDGCMVDFDQSSLEGLDSQELSIGDWVESDEMDRMEGRRAAKVKPITPRTRQVIDEAARRNKGSLP